MVPITLDRGVEEPSQVVRGENVGDELVLGSHEDACRQNLMAGVFDMQEPCGTRDIPVPVVSRSRRRRRPRPLDGGLRVDVIFAPGGGKGRERTQIFPCLFELEAERPAQREIALDIVDQHAGLPAQGWAISERSAKSTLA